MDAFRTAYVYIRNVFAGALYETDEGYSFSYDEQYLAGRMQAPYPLPCRFLKKHIHPKRCSRSLTD